MPRNTMSMRPVPNLTLRLTISTVLLAAAIWGVLAADTPWLWLALPVLMAAGWLLYTRGPAQFTRPAKGSGWRICLYYGIGALIALVLKPFGTALAAGFIAVLFAF